MGKITGFMEFQRQKESYLPADSRVKNYKEFILPLKDVQAKTEGARCMDCGTPFCMTGCPVNNIIPDWNQLVYSGNYREALETLHSTNNFPEFTGRICPAPCESACVLAINNDAVGIKSIEHFIIDKGWKNGWVMPQPAAFKTGKKIAVVGSGPAGLAAAQQLARVGHAVTVFEKNDRIGGLLRYGIPGFKMEKSHIDRRIEQMQAEGVQFRTSVLIGEDFPSNIINWTKEAISPKQLDQNFDAIILAGGAELPRDLPVPGRELKGVHFAMEFLPQQNQVDAGDKLNNQIMASGKHVVVIGGGDTGSDCVGTCNRHSAASLAQFELMPQPPEQEDKPLVWPYWPIKLRTSSSQEEGCDRDWAVATKRFEGKGGKVEKLIAARVEWIDGKMQEVPNSEFEMKADLVLLAMGFVSPVTQVLEAFAVDKDGRGNVKATTDGDGCYQTSVDKVFAAGDMRRGQSLVVWAIREGRQAARAADEFLMGASNLPR
ncbi:glutamate synthase subunit beta [Marinobacter psychrophilus]|jgi:glutamate synthase (NADPH/NADH) small chain|uniref:glutamate synthase subunit beta n=1 Tax=Marinobacter psychrophilus TaxID=330734 RepID=UPI001B51756C|nr:glutamate synthase subunit beta [Marinobacter psychrophilus]MBQ0763101.1 glutamate synthase subunit beta [Marinobacter psychrophilus]MBQ0844008.1 glutamate synthase subunit beta [Marinobacter psychrophilus]